MRSRRIGRNELDAIEICPWVRRGAARVRAPARERARLNQYAQRIISTPGTQDGLAWRKPTGPGMARSARTVARAIEQGYTSRSEPYHGYFFKVLKGQGPAAPLGEMDFVVKNVMIGGFALVAAPAAYGVTGVKTFIVSHDGVVYEKDLGTATLDEFKKMERFNPDRSWTPGQVAVIPPGESAFACLHRRSSRSGNGTPIQYNRGTDPEWTLPKSATASRTS